MSNVANHFAAAIEAKFSSVYPQKPIMVTLDLRLFIQSDFFSERPSVTVLRQAPLFRIDVEPSSENGLNLSRWRYL